MKRNLSRVHRKTAQPGRRVAGVQPAPPADAGRTAKGHRRPGRRDRADLRRHLHPRALPAGRRAGPGQDPDGQHAGADPRHPVQAHPVHARPDAVGHHRHERAGGGRRRAGANFRFVEGPIFTNILLADEINRTPPKTQAALLQAMQEREVTVGQQTYPLPDPFFAIATQNPIEQEGTYPLPEAQLDRFMFNIKVDYPSADEEERILASTTRGEKAEVRKVLSGKAILNLQDAGGQGGRERVHRAVRRPAGPRHAAEGRVRAAVRQGAGRLGRGPAGGPVPDPGRQGPGRHGRPLLRGHRRRAEDRHPRAAAPHQHQLPGPGRRHEQRRHHPAADPRDAAAGDSEV